MERGFNKVKNPLKKKLESIITDRVVALLRVTYSIYNDIKPIDYEEYERIVLNAMKKEE